ncbi:MAG: low molecular weight phosphotyrosine protein phosphatase [Bdellovibrionales bacterium]|nr:low molecular weight phosphotyrosine protein phosphatase [Bdellovibrionales bacterium]
MVKVLFVCLGNICRSPAAEGTMQWLLEERQLTDQIFCDSAGTSAYHCGEPADIRMQETARERGIELRSISRQLIESDFHEFDYILTMDHKNLNDVKAMDYKNKYADKIKAFTDFCSVHDIQAVPDPYYGNVDGFNLVMDIVEDGCKGFIDFLIKERRVIL